MLDGYTIGESLQVGRAVGLKYFTNGHKRILS
jgi:hypothetical protein